MEKQIIIDAHESKEVGQHSGIQQTFGKIANKFFSPNMFEKIKKYVQSCDLCQKYKLQNRPHGQINERLKPETKIFERLTINVLGPIQFRKFKREFYIVVLVDQFSKFLYLKAFYNINSATIIDTLNELFINFPCPEKIHTDNAPYFRSNKMKEYLEDIGAFQSFSLKYSPITNGLRERSNWLIDENNKQPRDSLQQTIKLIQRAYNNCPNPSLRGKSPNYVLFGVEDRFLSQKHNIPLEENNDEDRRAELNQFRKEVPKILSENFKKYAAYFNKSKMNIQFHKNEEPVVQNQNW